MSGVWVFIEHQDGQLKAISKELLGAGRTVSDGLGAPLTALVFGQNVGDVAASAFDHGADAVVGCDDASLARFRVEAAGSLLADLARSRGPQALLVGGSTTGRDLAAWVAAALDAGMVSDGIALAVEGDRVKVTRPVYAGKLLATVYVKSSLQIVTLRSRAFPAAAGTGKTGAAEWVSPAKAEADIPTKIIGMEAKDAGISLTDANIIVSGGRGVGGPEGFAPVRELANVLGGALGASRAAVDAGWIPYDHQVGQTGKTVSPDLYVACGISGAIQHQAGMRTSKVIVAINKDAEAPIFKLAQYGIVGDLFKVVPALSAEFRKRLGK
ncbi:MAG: electron transfer flavoprotein subunit alpha/FixB family protein [Anaerolineales bacterium]|nr:electron transfer flavoprotein subunit alpha/FixB family protein [Anaerolineales bacterium]MCB8950963.1 electron transfer flavoprotein subunit alpha/FixB family protein [Ardenticatenales bacterium]